MADILDYIREVQQPRSRFQIERFVLGQHETIEMQFYQLCLELQASIFAIKRVELDIKRAKLKASRLRETGDELDALDAEDIELGLSQTEMTLFGAKRELDILLDIWKSFENKFSRQQIESGQEEYWNKRLIRQAEMQAIGQGSVDMGNMEALRQAGALESFLESQGLVKGAPNEVRNLEA